MDDDTVRVRVGANRMFEVQLLGDCPRVDWSTQIGIRSRAGGSWVCNSYDAELLVPGLSGGLDRCAVGNIRQLAPVEIEALRAARRR